MELALAHPPHHTLTPPPPPPGTGPPPSSPRRLRSPVDSMAASQRASSHGRGGSRGPPAAAGTSSRRTPPVHEATPSILFLHHDPGATSADGSTRRGSSSALTAAARAHASRRGHSKNADKARKSFRFVSVSSDGSQIPSSGVDNDDTAGITTSSQPESRTSSVASSSSSFSGSSGPRRSVTRSPDYHARQQAQGQQNFYFVDGSTALVNARVLETAAEAAAKPPRSLTADQWDPFESLSVHNLSKGERFMLHYALTTTWAKFGESQSGAAELAQSWIWATIESPAALFAQIAGAAAHYLTVPYSDGATQRNTFTTMLQTKQKAIKALQHEVDLFQRRQAEQKAEKERRELEQLREDTASPDAVSPFTQTPSQWAPPTEHSSSQQISKTVDLAIRDYPTPPTASSPIQADSPLSSSSSPSLSTSVAAQPISASAAAAAGATDSMVLAILVLAVHDSIELAPVPDPHPLAPLATYRDMHIYGQMTMKEVHMDMLYGLVEQKGGFKRMNHSVFGYVLPPADMLFNLCRGSPPRIPSHRTLRPLRGTNAWQPDYQAGFLLTAVGTGFHAVQVPSGRSFGPSTTGLDEEMLSLLHVMAELTVAFDHFVRASPGAPKSLDFFVNNADLVGHRLMCKSSYFDEPVEVLTPEVTQTPTQQQSPNPAIHRFTTTSASSAISSPTHSIPSPSPPPTLPPKPQADIGTTFTPSGTKILRYPRSTVLRELSLIAARLYTDMVIFPTPAQTGVKLRNAAQMLPLLRAFRRDRLRNEMSGMMSTADWAAEDADEEKIQAAFEEKGMEAHEYCRVEIINEDDETPHSHNKPDPSSSTSDATHTHRPGMGGSGSEALQDFISWSLLLATICSRLTPLADIYITQLSLDLELNYNQQQTYTGGIPVSMPQVLMHQQYGGLMGQMWPEYRARMMRFLWLGSVCDDVGEMVWGQAMALRGARMR